MAEVTTALSNRNGRVSKLRIPRVDLTPMVDLGFLLLTFFVFSSTISLPKSMTAIYPDDRSSRDGTEAKASGVLTLFLGNNGSIYFQEGLADESGKSWHQGNMQNIRETIRSKKSHTQKDDFVVLIKPGEKSSYGNLVSILDEMKISMVDRYTIVDPSPNEQMVINGKEQNAVFVK
ncbi:MAG: biopolymer transporter ExbD [Pseudopedobacter saltans]|uniref:Biopolymer transporter ExbD n=1 Tax=Pseudopedobacter saltans TaxID=151895 RepID=A0A2W5H0Q8_9SPHI|nr:MAG: biopolymer transporter ExbD [Pseudopedobacter saltans]